MQSTLATGIGMTSKRTRERLVERLQEQGISDTAVLQAILDVPRHLFLDEALAHRAYEDTSLPIGLGQTISQPYTVAKMTETLLQASRRSKVLEIGTGSGYQTAILAHFFAEVCSIERLSSLLDKARCRFRSLGLRNIWVTAGDGSLGWQEHAPYDAIMVTAAAERLPETLLHQLADGGSMVLPVVKENGQELQHIVRDGNTFECISMEPVNFVPLISESGA